jgi:hypothetical protein
MVRYNDEEYGLVEAAASRSRLTTSGFAAACALAAALEQDPPAGQPMREALAELLVARTQVRRFAVNVNQAVAALHATGEAPEWFERAVNLTSRAVERLDAAADLLTRRLP